MRNVVRLMAATAVTVAAITFMGSSTATAAPAPAQTSTKSTDTGAYVYKVTKGENMTYLVRKSVLLYDQHHTQITLSHPQVVYAETNIVQDMGSPKIYPATTVSVAEKDIARYATKSQSLTKAEIAAWQTYADKASFELGWITPTEQPGSSDNAKTEQDKNTPAKNSTNTSKNAATNSQPQTTTQKQNTDKNGNATKQDTGTNDWYWWVLAGCVVIVIGYFWWSARHDEA